MKIYIVMVDDSEYHDGSYRPEKAFTNKETAEKYGKVTTDIWGDYLIEECDVDATDILWVVTSEEAYSSGEVSFRDAFATEDEANAYAKEISDDTYHEHSTYFNAEVDDVHIDEEIGVVESKYEELEDRIRYKAKFKPGDKVRMLTLEEMLSMDGVEKKCNEFGTDMIKNKRFHAPVWICLADQVTEYMGKSFKVEKTLGDCVFTPNGHFFQEWMFVHDTIGEIVDKVNEYNKTGSLTFEGL